MVTKKDSKPKSEGLEYLTCGVCKTSITSETMNFWYDGSGKSIDKPGDWVPLHAGCQLVIDYDWDGDVGFFVLSKEEYEKIRYEDMFPDRYLEYVPGVYLQKRTAESLEKSIKNLYKNRRLRDLLGEEGIVARTVGHNFKGPNDFEPFYLDSKRGKVKTEFAEALEAFEEADKDPGTDRDLDIVFEVGDILLQKKIVELHYRTHDSYREVSDKFDVALQYFKGLIEERNINPDAVEKLCKLKYGIRAWLGLNLYDAKKKEVETKVCLDFYEENFAERVIWREWVNGKGNKVTLSYFEKSSRYH